MTGQRSSGDVAMLDRRISRFERLERRIERFVATLPYILLGLATVVSMIGSTHTLRDRLIILGLVAVAAAWLFGMCTVRRPKAGERVGAMVVYFAGVLLLAGLLMTRDVIFFMFAVTGFVQPFYVLPKWLAVAGVGITSAMLNAITFGLGSGWPTDPAVMTSYVGVVVIQTVLIGGLGAGFTSVEEQRRAAMVDLQVALKENAGLHEQLLTQAREAGVLDERQRLAREIHDTLAQGLTGIITQLEAAESRGDHPADRRHLHNATRLARESLSEARRTVHAIRPEPLEVAQLPEALAEVVGGWSTVSGVPAEVTTTGTPLPLHPEVEITLLRTAQEALANVAKHAGAGRVGLTLSYMEDVVTLDVRDDGSGFDPARLPADGERANGDGGFGLTAMRQRLHRIAGTLEIESEPGAGTALSARVPAILSRGAP